MPVGMNLWRVSHSVMEALFCGAWGGPGNLQMQERLDPEETLAWESSGAIRASFQMEIWPFCASSKCCRISLQPAASLKEPCCWIALPLENDAHSLFFFLHHGCLARLHTPTFGRAPPPTTFWWWATADFPSLLSDTDTHSWKGWVRRCSWLLSVPQELPVLTWNEFSLKHQHWHETPREFGLLLQLEHLDPWGIRELRTLLRFLPFLHLSCIFAATKAV